MPGIWPPVIQFRYVPGSVVIFYPSVHVIMYVPNVSRPYSCVLFLVLSFSQGVLVESLRKGYWIILDELNLAPSEVSVRSSLFT